MDTPANIDLSFVCCEQEHTECDGCNKEVSPAGARYVCLSFNGNELVLCPDCVAWAHEQLKK